ncbi:ABC transporter ATP-binding protein [Asanoa sp. WMMD1127]|uniref:ABC transporter ATP-binding protein n=1 Tax=Asanoa sp. WMMD1127 TaxID=3016107 RepID=UPI0024173EAE|nr:ABC transporter ATP-binding protein [Asanoa sp. WMMD1127]MDG4823482.1 ABC transporter ATP-binding protein [Asanoa sp. WMMD1127]
MTVVLRVDDLRVHYRTLRGDVRALDGVSFTVADGEIMGVVGESGCGKSTLGKSLVRLDNRMKHVGGKVTVDDEALPIDDDQAMNRFRFKTVSVIPQYAMSALNPTVRIRRLVSDLLTAHGIDFTAARPELLRRLDLVGLPERVLDNYPIELSGGMKQRVVLVLSTLRDPAVLVADEVTSALDVSTQRAVAETLVQFRDRGYVRSMLVVTHDISLVYQIADTIMVMYAGRLAEKAPSDVVVTEPLHPYTQLLIGALPEVGARFTDRRLTGIPGRPPGLRNPPQGCRFRARCPLAFDKCAEQPPFVEVAKNHQVACWKAGS